MTADGIELPEELALRLGLPFTNLALLRRALTHRSYLNENPYALEDNERLEYLGDAVLDFLVGEWLYNHFPEMQEGQLTRMRSALVRTDQLAEFARQLNLGAALMLGRGEREAGGSQRPSLLCATFEALVGALYLNAGLTAVVTFVEPLLLGAVQPDIEPSSQQDGDESKGAFNDPRDQDPKGLLQEWAQGHGLGTPVYQIISSTGPEHDRSFEVQVVIYRSGMQIPLPGEGDSSENYELPVRLDFDADGIAVLALGRGRSKQQATKAAARNALDNFSVH